MGSQRFGNKNFKTDRVSTFVCIYLFYAVRKYTLYVKYLKNILYRYFICNKVVYNNTKLPKFTITTKITIISNSFLAFRQIHSICL